MQETMVFRSPRWLLRLFQGLAFLGGVALAAGLFVDAPQTWANLLLVSNYLVGLALGGLVIVALHYVTGARWSVSLRRLPEALALALPVAGVVLLAALLAVLILHPSLYSWTAPEPAAESSPLRDLWLTWPFFLIRAALYVGVWLVFALAIVRTSRRQDRDGNAALTRRNVRLSAGFLVAFGVTCWLASYDWLMSLEPEWSSTIFGVYNFAGLFLSALAAVTLLAVCLRRQLQPFVTADHFHDLGTLLFAFSSFWMYTWFCQYMLIWYTNHPEETSYLTLRWQGDWPVFVLLDLVLGWGIPFVVLLFRSAKRNPYILAVISLLILAGRWVDLFVMIFPSQGQALAIPGLIEAGLMLGAAGVFVLAILHALSGAPLVPVNDPALVDLGASHEHPRRPLTSSVSLSESR
jgi:hypothetical protein